MSSEGLVKLRGPESDPKISTRQVIKAVSEQTGQTYEQVADSVYAFLHYVKYAALATGQKIVIRNFGNFYLSRTKGRVYGRHVNAETYHPDRMKLTMTSSLQEVDRWKSTQSIQQTVVNALDVALRQSSMDLSVCVRIADLVLSNKPLPSLKGRKKVEFVRQWVYATGANPLIPAITSYPDSQDQDYHIVRFRLRSQNVSAYVFDHEPDPYLTSITIDGPKDVLFLEDGWASGSDLRHARNNNEEEFPRRPFGKSPEDHCAALYHAYLVTKYGEKATKESQ